MVLRIKLTIFIYSCKFAVYVDVINNKDLSFKNGQYIYCIF